MLDNKKILIVEDDISLLNALTKKFTKEKFNVIQATTGEEGLEVAFRERPDLILLDIIMPKMDGMTMLKKLRAEKEWGKIVPVIILTNLTSDNDQIIRDITETEPSYYFVKSDWKIEDIVEKVRERLGE